VIGQRSDSMFHEDVMEERGKRWKGMSPGRRALTVMGWGLVAAAVLALVGLAIMLLWNRIMSRTLGLPALGYWEALGLFVLFKLLLGGKGPSMMGRMRMRRAMREHMARHEEEGKAE